MVHGVVIFQFINLYSEPFLDTKYTFVTLWNEFKSRPSEDGVTTRREVNVGTLVLSTLPSYVFGSCFYGDILYVVIGLPLKTPKNQYRFNCHFLSSHLIRSGTQLELN